MAKSKIEKVIHTEEILVTRPTFLKRLASFRNILAVLILAFAAVTLLVKFFDFFNLDLNITVGIQQFHPKWFDILMRFISHLGNVFYGGVILIVSCAFLFLIRKYKALLMLFI